MMTIIMGGISVEFLGLNIIQLSVELYGLPLGLSNHFAKLPSISKIFAKYNSRIVNHRTNIGLS